MIYRFKWKAKHTLLWAESKAVRIRFSDRTSCTDGFAVSDHCSFVLLLKRLNEKLMYNYLVKSLKLYKYMRIFGRHNSVALTSVSSRSTGFSANFQTSYIKLWLAATSQPKKKHTFLYHWFDLTIHRHTIICRWSTLLNSMGSSQTKSNKIEIIQYIQLLTIVVGTIPSSSLLFVAAGLNRWNMKLSW